MAFIGVTLLSVVQESQDSMQVKIWDESTWAAQSGDVTDAHVVIQHYSSDGVLVTFDPYYLIVGGVKTKFNEYLDKQNGHIINLADLLIDGSAHGLTRFADGYYIVTLHVTDGSYGLYSAGGWPKYANNQAFLAKYRFMKRTMPARLLAWPLTESEKSANYDIYALGLYIDAAEYAADLGRLEFFNKYIYVIEQILDFYSVPQPW